MIVSVVGESFRDENIAVNDISVVIVEAILNEEKAIKGYMIDSSKGGGAKKLSSVG